MADLLGKQTKPQENYLHGINCLCVCSFGAILPKFLCFKNIDAVYLPPSTLYHTKK